ncbi:PIG-L family deacetylase [Kribbella turkmenica]|uniref:PIG-L family deacetylase n=1 Tax=Kribbella turkmenica TaxID=2530375 RepID=A0A4R4WQG3_9ACTN|nr:PIG-L deacetylase family protein [Kribbella turkmenica]TDD18995.1 PIG-L family deacetylase [Kribbella turkmenica]
MTETTFVVGEDLGTVLGVWAHPDDEAYLSAGTMAALRDAGHRVVVATATYGEQGTEDPDSLPPDRLAAIREDEMQTSLAVAGVQEHHWLGYRDGECGSAEGGVAAVARLIDEVRPDTILTFGPDGMTGHADHRAVCAWTTEAWRAAGGQARLLYATLTPGFHEEWGALNDRLGLWLYGDPPVTPEGELALYVTLDGADLDRKIKAVLAHVSQTSGLAAEVGAETFRRWWRAEAFVAADRTP